MSSISFSQSEGPLGTLFAESGVSHAAKISSSRSLVTTSGQPGFDLQSGKLVTSSIRDEMMACFDCVEAALKSAGVSDGLAAVHKMHSFLLDIRHESVMMEVWRERMPHHKPAWITLGVSQLAVPGMHVEMMAEASTND